jgi:hypothetical protein
MQGQGGQQIPAVQVFAGHEVKGRGWVIVRSALLNMNSSSSSALRSPAASIASASAAANASFVVTDIAPHLRCRHRAAHVLSRDNQLANATCQGRKQNNRTTAGFSGPRNTASAGACTFWQHFSPWNTPPVPPPNPICAFLRGHAPGDVGGGGAGSECGAGLMPSGSMSHPARCWARRPERCQCQG